jgi:methylmalonyl-CoA/ethylmalonyl-CoA epimerase
MNHKDIALQNIEREEKMSELEDLRDKLCLPAVSQIGIVVRSVEKTISYYESMLGIGPFSQYEWSPDKHWHGDELSFIKFKMGKVTWHGIELELIEPLEGISDHAVFLREHGEGLHHLGFNVTDYDEMFDKFLKKGFKPIVRGESYVEAYKGYLKACTFDTRKVGGVLFEIIWKSWLV